MSKENNRYEVMGKTVVMAISTMQKAKELDKKHKIAANMKKMVMS
jgi:hypothetical protein